MLVTANLTHYLEFKTIQRTFLVKEEKGGRMEMGVEAVPSSKGDIFRSSLGLLEKRRFFFLTNTFHK